MKKILKRFMEVLKTPELRILPGQLAFYFLMSIIPIIMLVFLLVSRLTIDVNVIETLEKTLPDTLAKLLLPLVNMNISNIPFAFLLVGYLVLASNGPRSICIASNALYKLEQPNTIDLYIKSFVMTIFMIILFIFMIFIPIFGETIIKFILDLFNSSFIFSKYKVLYDIIKVLISFVFIYVSVKALYTIAPNSKIETKKATKGALFCSFTWIIATSIFSFYISNIANYTLLYGNFANILILLLWIYLLAYLFVIGMAININVYYKK